MVDYISPDGSEKMLLRRSSLLSLIYILAYVTDNLNASAVESEKKDTVQNTLSTSSEVCRTKGCTDTAKFLLKNLDISINPCKNFYQFACGNFEKTEVLRPGTTSRDLFDITQANISEQLRSILENNIDDRQPRAFKLLQDKYKVCMDIAQMEKNGENDFRDILKSLNGWPVLEGNSWEEKKFDWKNTTYKLREIGYPIASILNIVIAPDRDDSTKNIIYLDTTGLPIAQENLSKGMNNPLVQAYFKYMVEFAVLFGTTRQQAENELTQSLNFQIELAKICLSGLERSDAAKLHTKMKIQELENKYKGVPWLEYLNNLVQPKRLLTSDDYVMVGPKIFFKNIGPLLAKTPKRAVANHLIWGVADFSSDKMSERLLNLSNQFYSPTSDMATPKPRWRICLSNVYGDMQIALSSIYVRKFFDESSKNEVSTMLEVIRNAYKDVIQTRDWMDSTTKKAAIEKLEIMQAHIGYPRELLDDRKVDDQYKNLTVDKKSFLKTQIAFDAAAFIRIFKMLENPVNKTDWTSHANSAVPNAFYSAPENSIQFPAGILQGQFFSKDRPKYLNYGTMGSIIGHEMTHGFDDEGSHFDEHGNFVNWWSPETKKKFNERAQGIVDQYSNFTGQKGSGKATEGEDIADNGGIKVAYQAYIHWSKQNSAEPGLPDLSYSAKQLFWLSYANTYCTKYLPKLKSSNSSTTEVVTGSHSSPRARVNIPLSNMLEFAIDYKCQLGTSMNPEKKYGVW